MKAFVDNQSINERLRADLEICTKKKKDIIDLFEETQHSATFDPNYEYNSSDKILADLKKKKMEVIWRDVIDSFERYH